MAVKTAMSARKRRLVYGLNVAFAVVLAAALLALVVWAAAAVGGRVDLTRSGVNSLAGRTVQLLRGLDQDITITGLYSTALKEIRPHAEKHQNRVRDLLDLYETAARGKVTTRMIDASESPAKVTALLKRLAGKPAYKDEAAPHIEALEAFAGLSARIVELAQGELSELDQLRNADRNAAQIRELGTVERFFRTIAQRAQETEVDIKTLEADEIPRYGSAVDLVNDYLSQTQNDLERVQTWMTVDAKDVPEILPETREFFASASERYKAVLTAVTDLLDKAKDLERVKLEELYEQLKRGQTVLVETQNEAVVLSQDEVWPWRTNPNAPEPPDGDPRDFAGEQAISSAILQMTQKDKTAVIFVRFGGEPLLRPGMPPTGPMMQMPQAPYRGLNELLQRENFVTEEWDVQTQDERPKVEDAARIVYVVFPPEPPPQQNPMRPAPTPRISAEQKQRIFDAVAASGMAVFLTPWMPPSASFMPTPEKYEFNDYLKSNWGIEVKDTHLALEFAPHPQRTGLWSFANRAPTFVTSRAFHYTGHKIAEPLQGLPAAFQSVAPLALVTGEDKPADVTVEPVIELNDTEDVWAIKDVNRINEDFRKQQGTRRYEDDVPAPFPLALAATGGQGHKLVVFASDRFIADAVVNMTQFVMVGNSLRLARLYPGNSDLFVNALHWLTGNADRIAVGPQPSDVPRLEKLKDDATLTFTRVFLVGIWPGVALLVGAGVWLLRRR